MKKSKAQSVSEYSICVLIIILAIIAMQVYVKRGLQARYADITDFATARAQARAQYEPYYQKEDLGSTQDVIENRVDGPYGESNRVIIRDSQTRAGTIEDLINYDADINYYK